MYTYSRAEITTFIQTTSCYSAAGTLCFLWSAPPATEKYHILLTTFKKPQQHQEQTLSIPQWLTPPPPGQLWLLKLPAKRESELTCELAAKMFCLPSRAPLLPAYKTPFLGSHARDASVTARNGKGKSFISVIATAQRRGCSWHRGHGGWNPRGRRVGHGEEERPQFWSGEMGQERLWQLPAEWGRAWRCSGLGEMETGFDTTFSCAEGSERLS